MPTSPHSCSLSTMCCRKRRIAFQRCAMWTGQRAYKPSIASSIHSTMTSLRLSRYVLVYRCSSILRSIPVASQSCVHRAMLLGEDPQRIEYYFGEARKVAQELGIDLRLPHTRMRLHPPGTPGPKRCDWPWRGAYFSYQGFAMPCCMVSTPDRINFGKVPEQRAEELWNSVPYQEFRDQLSSEELPEICRSCSVYRGTFWC
jgi:radical SAM protein with 4Fe4S-binding SPASM domain